MWWLFAGFKSLVGLGSGQSKEDAAHGGFKIRALKDGVQILAKGIDDLSPLMDQIGRYLRQVSQVAFLNQSFNGQRWVARAGSATRPSIMGVVQDLDSGSSIHPARFTDRPALVTTGALRRSITYLPTRKTVRVASTLPYAKLHQEGGVSTLPITSAARSNLKTLLREQPNLRPTLGFLFRRSSVTTVVPARPFLGVPDGAKAHIEDMTRDYLERAAHGHG